MYNERRFLEDSNSTTNQTDEDNSTNTTTNESEPEIESSI